jgi:antitoxin component of MazEF toxin-antitoxin module
MPRGAGFIFHGSYTYNFRERGVSMSRKRITASEDSATLLLPREILDAMGVNDGDEIDVAVIDRTLILRSLDEAERARKVGAATEAVFERRKSVFEELAKGAE